MTLPIPDWMLAYRKEWLAPDVIAGLTAAAVVIPKALAYATIAGLPVEIGLYTVFVPMLIYAEKLLREEDGIRLWLVGMNPDVLAVIRRSALGQTLTRERMFFTLDLAADKYQAEHADAAWRPLSAPLPGRHDRQRPMRCPEGG